MEVAQRAGTAGETKTTIPWWRRILRVISYAYSALMLISGVAVLSALDGSTPRLAGVGHLLAGLITFPPLVAVLRTKVAPMRPIWVPPLLAVGVVLSVSPLMPPREAQKPASAQTSKPAAPPATKAVEGPRQRPQRPDANLALYPYFAKTQLAPRLRDPDSANITSLMVFRTGERLTLCGKVNAKNGYGGYSGPQAFVLTDEGVLLGDAELTGEKVLAACQGETTQVVPDQYLD